MSQSIYGSDTTTRPNKQKQEEKYIFQLRLIENDLNNRHSTVFFTKFTKIMYSIYYQFFFKLHADIYFVCLHLKKKKTTKNIQTIKITHITKIKTRRICLGRKCNKEK